MNTKDGIRHGRVLLGGEGEQKKAGRAFRPREVQTSVRIKWRRKEEGVRRGKVSDCVMLPRKFLPGQRDVFELELPFGRGPGLAREGLLKTSAMPRHQLGAAQQKHGLSPCEHDGKPRTAVGGPSHSCS